MAPTRVLLVEDDQEVAGFLRDLLGRKGYRVRHARSGTEALAAIACQDGGSYDAVLLDWNLPFYQGGKLLSLIRESSRMPELPVIVLTGSASPEDRESALPLGVSAFLRKPSSAGEILAALQAAVAANSAFTGAAARALDSSRS